MRAGRLRHRVTIQQKSPTRDAFGGEIEAWTDVATVWASIHPLEGREFLQARQLQAEVTTRIHIRRREGIRPEMRVVWGNHVYDVLSVIEPEYRRDELVLMCREEL